MKVIYLMQYHNQFTSQDFLCDISYAIHYGIIQLTIQYDDEINISHVLSTW